MIKIILFILAFRSQLTIAQEEFQDTEGDTFSEEYIDEESNSDETIDQMGSKENKDNKKNVSQPESIQNVEENNVTDLGSIDFNEKELEWSNRSEAEDDMGDISIIEEIIENNDDYSYAGFRRPDPFKEPSIDELKRAYLIQEARFKKMNDNLDKNIGVGIPMVSSLQYYKLKELQVKGIWVSSSGEPRAIVRTPKNEGVIVKKDDPISAGKIIEIDKEKIIARQYKIQSDGTRTYKDWPLYLKKPKDILTGSVVFEAGKDVKFEKTIANSIDLEKAHTVDEVEKESVSIINTENLDYTSGIKPTSTKIISRDNQVEDSDTTSAEENSNVLINQQDTSGQNEREDESND